LRYNYNGTSSIKRRGLFRGRFWFRQWYWSQRCMSSNTKRLVK